MITIYIPIGLPGCGKSYYYKQFILSNINERFAYKLSADEIRFKLLDSDKTKIYFDPEKEGAVWAIFNLQLQECLFLEYQTIYIDNTNLTFKRRNQIYEIVKQSDKEVQYKYIIFTASVEDCLKNQKGRERQVKKHILEKMVQEYEGLKGCEIFQPNVTIDIKNQWVNIYD